MECCTVWKKRKIRLLAFCLLLFFALDVWIMVSREAKATSEVSCSDSTYRQYIKELCNNYSRGIVPGTLCRDICSTKEIQYLKCLGHKDESIVALAEYRKQKLILKAELDLQSTIRLHFIGIPQEKFASLSENSSQIRYILLKYYNYTEGMADSILFECDSNHTGQLSFAETMYCWHLVDQDELTISLQLQDLDVVPSFYGTCGNLIAMEYAATLPLDQPLVEDVRSWGLRARLAIALIEMIEKLENTKYGTLHLCDFKESNFGVVQADGAYVAKSIDNDLSVFENSLIEILRYEKNNSCTTNQDCSYIHCEVQCNSFIGKCSGKLVSNNLQLLCKRFFVSSGSLMLYPLLHSPPLAIERELTSILHQCVFPLKRSTKLSRVIARKLKNLLKRSLTL